MVTAEKAGETKLLMCLCHGNTGMLQIVDGRKVYESSRKTIIVVSGGKMTIQKESNRQMHILVVDID